ncbi:GNAT family N-acetyltransferase [Actinomycetes bacterium M1A6_2h]
MVDIRVLESEADLIAAAKVFRTAMVGLEPSPPYSPGQIQTVREPGRTLAVFDGKDVVGSVDGFSSDMTVPGGARLPHHAVTRVGVLPTHTRRGIVSGLLTRQLRDARDRGEVFTSLRASEAVIYGRFGYAVANLSHTVEVVTSRARMRDSVTAGGPAGLVDLEASWDVLPGVYDSAPSIRPGSIGRPTTWWNGYRFASQQSTDPSYVAVQGDSGFARYHGIGADTWFTGDNRTAIVDDFWAPTTEAYVGLIRFLFSLDLVTRFVFTAMPIDDPLPQLLIDQRAVRVTKSRDETWLRILDVPRALSSRTYRGAGAVTVAVVDPVLDENSGTFRISADGADKVNSAPDLTIDVTSLAAVYLGGTAWHQLAAAGAVQFSDYSAIERADALFSSHLAPHCGTDF